jgi:hypothetical protein
MLFLNFRWILSQAFDVHYGYPNPFLCRDFWAGRRHYAEPCDNFETDSPWHPSLARAASDV